MPPVPRFARASGALTAAALVLGATAARAQSATPLERFEPAPAGDAFFSTPSADVTSTLRPGVALAWSYAHDPLVVVAQQTGQREVIVSYQATMHALFSLELAKRFKLDVDVPGTLDQGGSFGTVGQVALQPVRGAELNDLRIGLRAVLLRQDGYVPAAAVGFTVWAPTGQDTAYTGSGSARLAPFVVVGAD
jgi:OmpA-OmpF porin, OOP family